MSSVQTPTKPSQAMSTPKPTDQGLVKAPKIVEGEIVTAAAYNQQVATWRAQGLNVLTPAAVLSTIPRDHTIVVNAVQINPDPAGGEVYQNPLFTRGQEVALSKTGLERIAQSAGISIDEIQRVDSGDVALVWTYRVYGHWIGFNGQRIDRVATKTLDLRDSSPEIKGFTANQIEQARRHGEAVCESKAINRLYRQYGLKQKFQRSELERPFIVMKLQWEPDMSNPVVAAIVTQLRAGATQLLYPQGMPGAVDPAKLLPHETPPELRPAGPARDVDDEDPPVNDASTGATPFEPDAPAVTKPAVYTVSGVFKKANGGFYLTTHETFDEPLHTPDEGIAKAAFAAKKASTPVTLDLQDTPQGRVILKLAPADEY